MKCLLIILVTCLVSCTSVEINVSNPGGSTTVITGVEKSLFDQRETLSLTLSKQNGGQIQNISWQGKKLLNKPVSENFPNEVNDFKKKEPWFSMITVVY